MKKEKKSSFLSIDILARLCLILLPATLLLLLMLFFLKPTTTFASSGLVWTPLTPDTTGAIAANDEYGRGVAAIGDLDGNGVSELAVGTRRGGSRDNGSVYVLFMNADGTVASSQLVGSGSNIELYGSSVDGIGDLDGDTVPDLVIGAPTNNSAPGKVYVQLLNANGTAKGGRVQVATGSAGSFGKFGWSVSYVGVISGNPTIAVGDQKNRTVTLYRLNTNGTSAGSIAVPEANGYHNVGGIGNLNGAGGADLAVGNSNVVDTNYNQVEILFLDSSGVVTGTSIINNPSTSGARFGSDFDEAGDIDGDGVTDLVVGANQDNSLRGSIWVLLMNADGTVKSLEQHAPCNAQGSSLFGYAVANLGDIDSDGYPEFAVGAPLHDIGASLNRGAVYIMDGQLSSNTYSINDAAVLEGDVGNTNLTFTITRNLNTSSGSVDVSTSDGTATTADSDYTALISQTVNFAACGSLTENVNVVVIGDTKPETDETFTATLSDLVGGTAGDVNGTGTILNDDIPSTTITLTGGTAKNEGDSGFVNHTFTATLSAPVVGGFNVAYTTNDGTATAGSDYVHNAGLLNFAGNLGEQQFITVTVNGDLEIEADETFSVTLGAISGTAESIGIDGSPQISTILNDDSVNFIINKEADVRQPEPGDTVNFTIVASNKGNVDTTSAAISDTIPAGLNFILGSVNIQGGNGTIGIPPQIASDLTISGGETITVTFQATVTTPYPRVLITNTASITSTEAMTPMLARTVLHIANAQPVAQDDGYMVTVGNTLVVPPQGVLGNDSDANNDPLTVSINTPPSSGNLLLNPNGSFSYTPTLSTQGDITFTYTVTDGYASGMLDGSVGSSIKVAHQINGGPTLTDGDSFGFALTQLGDFNGDGIPDLGAGANKDGTGGTSRGAAYIFMMDVNGTVSETVKIAHNLNGGPSLANGDSFGRSFALAGDINGDGISDLVGGATGDDTGNANSGALHILIMNADGTVSNTVKIAHEINGGPTLVRNASFGTSATTAGDINNDGVPDLMVGATGEAASGAVYVLLMHANGTVSNTIKIANGLNGGPILSGRIQFGSAVAMVGDVNGDSIPDFAVGAHRDDAGFGAVYLLLMNVDGTVANSVKIGNSTNGGPILATGDGFGIAVSALGDINDDSIPDMVVGAPEVGDRFNPRKGSIYVLTLNSDGTAGGFDKITDGSNGGPTLALMDGFGAAIVAPGDIDGDGFLDLAVGAGGDDTGGNARGAFHVMFMNGDNGVSEDTATVTITVKAPILTISKSVNDTTPQPNDTLTYTVVISNSGDADALGIVVSDTIPAGLGFIANSVVIDGATGTTGPPPTLAEAFTVSAQSIVTVTYQVIVTSNTHGEIITNTVGVDADNIPTQLTDSATITVLLQADISVTKTDGVTSAEPGSLLTYTIVASNAGPSNDPSATLVDTFPANLTCTFTSVAAGGATGNTVAGSGNLNETLSLPAGSSVTYTASCAIASNATGTLSNTATITTSVFDPDPSNNSATDDDTILIYSLYLPVIFNNYANAPDLVVESLSVTSNNIQVTIKNQGTAPVTDVFWVDVYINPTNPPTGVNQTCLTNGGEGLVWGVTQSLAAGDVLVLTINDLYYLPSLCNFSGTINSGSMVYAQVDSANTDTNYGAVLENHEINGGLYNNIFSYGLTASLATINEKIQFPVVLPSVLGLAKRPIGTGHYN